MASGQERIWQPEPNLIESDAGFTVRLLGMVGIRYTEAGRSAQVESEVLATAHPAVMAWRDRIRCWEPPHDSEPLGDADRDRILGNIRRAFDAVGYELRVISNAPGSPADTSPSGKEYIWPSREDLMGPQ